MCCAGGSAGATCPRGTIACAEVRGVGARALSAACVIRRVTSGSVMTRRDVGSDNARMSSDDSEPDWACIEKGR